MFWLPEPRVSGCPTAGVNRLRHPVNRFPRGCRGRFASTLLAQHERVHRGRATRPTTRYAPTPKIATPRLRSSMRISATRVDRTTRPSARFRCRRYISTRSDARHIASRACLCWWECVPEEGFEPSPPCEERILSPSCLPFHHSGDAPKRQDSIMPFGTIAACFPSSSASS